MSVAARLSPQPIAPLSPFIARTKPVSDDYLLEDLAFQYGQVYDSYLACEAGRERFWSSEGAGAIAFVNVAGHLKVGGGLLAAAADRPRLLKEFLGFVSQKYKSAAFFNITDVDLPLFQEYGIQVTKWGEDTLIDLQDWSCQGKAFEWLRRQRNYCVRQKVSCAEWHPHQCLAGDFQATQAELREVVSDSLQFKPQSREMQFFVGQLDFQNLGRKRIFLARADEGRGRIEAVVVANPYQSGTAWAFEIFRHRRDAVRGVAPYLKQVVIEQLKAEGAQQVSLCLIPGLNCQTIRTGDSGLVRRALTWTSRHLNSLYDCSGLHHYKSRFRPRLENRYICTFPRVSPMSFLTTVHLTGLLRLSPVKVARLVWRHWMSRARTTLPKLADHPTE